MKKWIKMGIIPGMVIGMVLMSGCLGSPSHVVSLHFLNGGNPLTDATVTASSGASKQTGTTDSFGNVVFTMTSTVKYDIVVSYQGHSNYYEIYPQSNYYGFSFSTPPPKLVSQQIQLHFWTQKNATNPSYTDLGASYYDAGSSTDKLIFTVYHENETSLLYRTSPTPNSWNTSFPVLMSKGTAYVWGIRGNSTDFSQQIAQSEVIRFPY